MAPLVRCRVVHKFGGAALADAAAVRHAGSIVARGPVVGAVVVASAMAGVTDELLRIATAAAAGGVDDELRASVARLETRHDAAAAALDLPDDLLRDLRDVIAESCADLTRRCGALAEEGAVDADALDIILARGERLSAQLMTARLAAQGIAARYVDAMRVVHTDGRHGAASPDIAGTTEAAQREIQPLLDAQLLPVVPGFIGSAPDGRVVTLGRGGSDLTATLLARVLGAPEVMLWKDVPGMLTADPRQVPDARLIPALHVREASELAYYGARVLHPRALIALGGEARLYVRPLADPEAPGTTISSDRPDGASARFPVKALAALEDQAVVTIQGNGMAGVPGVAARAFGALEQANISVSFIAQASSEHSICIGIPGSFATTAERALLEAFSLELARGEIDGIDLRTGATTLAVVGLGMAGHPGIAARLFGALADAGINIVAIAQGASELNISFVVDGADSGGAQRAIHGVFRLDKIGGGTAVHATHADVILLGFGQVGRELAAGIGALPRGRGVRLVGVIDRSGYLFDARGVGAKRIAALAAAKRSGEGVATARGGRAGSPAEALSAMTQYALSRPMLVDVTADETGALLETAVTRGMDLVLANKRPLAADRHGAEALMRAVAGNGRRLLHEATVGAGLPIIDTIHKLLEAGDQILRIEACPSGTLGYLFGELERGVSFSAALRAAMSHGYTEPDPRDDLSGMDVARKALILARLIGFDGELGDLAIESLVAPEHRALALSEFLDRLEELDAPWAARVETARVNDTVLRYQVNVTARRAQVGVAAVPMGSSFAALSGTDNQFVFTTRRYRTNPLVITGPGAGVEVTAAGVLNDVLKLTSMR